MARIAQNDLITAKRVPQRLRDGIGANSLHTEVLEIDGHSVANDVMQMPADFLAGHQPNHDLAAWSMGGRLRICDTEIPVVFHVVLVVRPVDDWHQSFVRNQTE